MRPSTRIVEGSLYLVAALSAFWAALWLAGVNGFGWLALGNLPRWLDPVTLYGTNAQWAANPSVLVQLDSRTSEGVLRAYDALNTAPDALGRVPTHWGEISSGPSSVQLWDLSATQQVSYLLLQLAVFAAIGFVAVTLARLVADSRTETPFTPLNVSRLRRIGLLLLAGAPVASVAHWACVRWMVESSSVGDQIKTFDYGLSSLPWWTVVVGAAVLVLADVWRRGVQMAADVSGLV